MKNLLAHFRKKPSQPAEEPVKSLEPAKPAAEPIRPARLQTAVARAIKPAWHATAAPFPQKPRTPALAERALPTEIVTLRLGDFLDRIPPELLDTGTPDRSIPMPFDLSSLSERIGRGEAMIRVSEVYRRMPDVFRSDAAIHAERMIPFPWKRVLAMIEETKAGAADSGISPAGVEALAHKFKARKLRQPGKMAPVPHTAGEAGAESAPDGAMSVAPTTAGLRIAAPSSVAQNNFNAAGGAADAATTQELAQLRAERDAALARAAEFGAEYDSALGRTGELSDERDTAVARVAELTAGHDAAVARAAEMAAERDAAIARAVELIAVRDASAARIEKLVADSQATVTRAADLTAGHDAGVARVNELTTERDAALARATEFSAERDAAVARVTAITAEREAAVARAEKLAADCEAALALGTELTAERDTLTARMTALTSEREAAEARATAITAERDAAVARAEKLAAENEAALVRSRDSSTDREGVDTRAAALSAERDAALQRIDELTTERDAAAARTAELLKGTETAKPTDAAPSAATDTSLVIEGYKNTIDALLRERDELRKIHGRPAGNAASAISPADAKATEAGDPSRDVYAELFPASLWFPRAAAAAVLALLAAGVLSQMPLGAIWPTDAAASTEILPEAEPEVFLPVLSEVVLPEERVTLESKKPVETMTLRGASAGLQD